MIPLFSNCSTRLMCYGIYTVDGLLLSTLPQYVYPVGQFRYIVQTRISNENLINLKLGEGHACLISLSVSFKEIQPLR